MRWLDQLVPKSTFLPCGSRKREPSNPCWWRTVKRDQEEPSLILMPQRAPMPLMTLNFTVSSSSTGSWEGGQTGRKAGAPPSLAQEASYILFSPPQAAHLQRSPAEVVGAGKRRGWGQKETEHSNHLSVLGSHL